jgi:hypothetical protein
MLLVKYWIHLLVLLLMVGIGLHVPKSFTLLYLFAALVFVLSAQGRSWPGCWLAVNDCRWRWSALLLLFFSITYVAGMFLWGFWVWPADRLDGVSALVLPSLLFVTGVNAAALGRLWTSRVLLAYGLAGLAYVLIALAFARQPWWAWTQIFPSLISLPWGAMAEMNVRSVEQNAYPALLLFPPALMLLGDPGRRGRQLLGMVFLGLSLLGAHAVWSLNGRLGWLALALACLPVLGLGLFKLQYWLRPVVIIGIAVVLAGAIWERLPILGGAQTAGIWSQGLCDERLSLYAGFLTRLHQAPWGGRLLRVSYSFCDQVRLGLLAADGSTGATIEQAHNVILDIYFSVGFVPVAFLLCALIPSLATIIQGFFVVRSAWDWQVLLRWGWLCFLGCQWLFQPLLYADGLLYYFSFFVLGLLVVEARRRLMGLEAEELSPKLSLAGMG